MIELRGIITGKVQGVRYRDYVQVMAGELGVRGYVENKPDGTVFVLAQGEPDSLKELIECLHEGSVLAEVESVAVEWGTSKKEFNDFSISIP